MSSIHQDQFCGHSTLLRPSESQKSELSDGREKRCLAAERESNFLRCDGMVDLIGCHKAGRRTHFSEIHF